MGGLAGARFATAGEDGVRVWRRDEARGSWEAEVVNTPADLASASMRDVTWRPWDGVCETLASASRQTVVIWRLEGESSAGCWSAVQRVAIGQEAWRLSWTDLGGAL